MTLTLWTQRYRVAWKPSLAYFKLRFDILDAIRSKFGSESFRVEGDEVGLRLGDDLVEFSLRNNGASFQVMSPSADASLVGGVLALVVDNLELRGSSVLSIDIQHLAPLEVDYDAARRLGAANLLPFLDDSYMPHDWSLLTDWEAPDKSAQYQTEFGIVEEAEITERVTRRRGRLRGPSDRARMPEAWNEIAKPDVAFFADTRGGIQKQVDLDAEIIWATWQDSVHNVEVFLADVLMGITNGKS